MKFYARTFIPCARPKLRDFLVYFKEIDLWAEYKNKQDLNKDIEEYTRAQKLAAAGAYKMYSSMRDYFMQPDVRAYYRAFRPIDEAELAEINRLHGIFVSSWPKDIRGEKSFVQMQIQSWTNHRNLIRDRIKSRQRRQAAMDPNHPKYAPEKQELMGWENVTLPMAEQELDKLRDFLATYDNIEKRKLEWYWMQKRGQAPEGMTEAEFLVQYEPKATPTARDIATWKAQIYEESLEKKNQYELLEEIRQRFVRSRIAIHSGCNIWWSIFRACATPARTVPGLIPKTCWSAYALPKSKKKSKRWTMRRLQD
jgi:hypothetical protein